MKFWSFKHNIVYVVLSLEFEDVFFYPIVIIIQLKLKLFLIILNVMDQHVLLCYLFLKSVFNKMIKGTIMT